RHTRFSRDWSSDVCSSDLMGVTWQSHCPDADGTYDPCLTETRSLESPEETASVTTEPPTKAPTAEFFLRGATPFTVYTRFDCNRSEERRVGKGATQAWAQR